MMTNKIIILFESILENNDLNTINDNELFYKHITTDDILFISESLKKHNIKFQDINFKDKTIFNHINNNIDNLDVFNNFMKKVITSHKIYSIMDLGKLYDFSHSTGAWNNNAELLINNNYLLDELIASREDLYSYFINHNIDEITATNIMTFIRKGRIKREPLIWDNYKKILNDKNIPKIMLETFEKIIYLQSKISGIAEAIKTYTIIYLNFYKRS